MKAKSGMLGWVVLQIFFLCVGLGSALGAMELPEKLKEVPLFAGSKITQVMDMGNGSMAMLTVKADRDAVLDFYKQNMKAKGWKVAFQAEQEESAVIHFTKDKQMIQLGVEKSGDEGMLQYHLMVMEQ